MGGDIALMQLRANVSHLQGQLVLAQGMVQLGQATIQAKNETINAQAMQLAMFQHNQLIQPGAAEITRLEQSTPAARPDSEPLFGNSVKVTPLKLKGIEVDLPNMLRALKRRVPGGKQ